MSTSMYLLAVCEIEQEKHSVIERRSRVGVRAASIVGSRSYPKLPMQLLARKFSIFWSSPFRSPAIERKYPTVRIIELKRVERRWRGGKRVDSIHLHPTHNSYQFHAWDMEMSARTAASTEVFASANNRVAENRDISHQLKPKKSTTVRQIIHNVSWHELDGKCTVDKKPHRDSRRKR